MNSAVRLLLLAAGVALLAWISRLRDAPERPVPWLFGLGGNLRGALLGRNGLWVGAAIAVTVFLALSGGDRWLQDLAQETDPLGRDVPWAVLRYGEWWSLALAASLLLVGWARRGPRWSLAGAVALQTVVAGVLVTLTLKLLTGRLGPASPEATHVPPFPKTDDASDFSFDAWRRVVDDGRFFWPSGHTLSSMALVTSLAAAFPSKRWIRWIGYPLVVFVAVAMVDGDFHWTSDVLAAAILGYPIGRTVGARLAAEHARRSGGDDAARSGQGIDGSTRSASRRSDSCHPR